MPAPITMQRGSPWLVPLIRVAHASGTEREQARRLRQSFRALVRDGRSTGAAARDGRRGRAARVPSPPVVV
jgi:hypothetical protein